MIYAFAKNESITCHADHADALQNLLMRRDFVSVMPLSCDLLSRGASLTDETLTVMPLFPEWSYIQRLVSEVINGFKRTRWRGYQTAYCTESIDFPLSPTVRLFVLIKTKT